MIGAVLRLDHRRSGLGRDGLLLFLCFHVPDQVWLRHLGLDNLQACWEPAVLLGIVGRGVLLVQLREGVTAVEGPLARRPLRRSLRSLSLAHVALAPEHLLHSPHRLHRAIRLGLTLGLHAAHHLAGAPRLVPPRIMHVVLGRTATTLVRAPDLELPLDIGAGRRPIGSALVALVGLRHPPAPPLDLLLLRLLRAPLLLQRIAAMLPLIPAVPDIIRCAPAAITEARRYQRLLVVRQVGLEELMKMLQVRTPVGGLLGLPPVEGSGRHWAMLLLFDPGGLVHIVLGGEPGHHVQDLFVVARPRFDVALHLLLQERLLDGGVEGARLRCLELVVLQWVRGGEELLVVQVGGWMPVVALLRVDGVACGLVDVPYGLRRHLVGLALYRVLERQMVRLVQFLHRFHVGRVLVD